MRPAQILRAARAASRPLAGPLRAIALALPLALPLAAPAAAQDLPFDAGIVATCMARADPSACIGLAAHTCAAKTGSNTGYGFCLRAELEVWDADLNRAYTALTDLARARDAEAADLGASTPPTRPILRDAQRAWIAWRDAQCAYTGAIFGGGTGAGPATTDCLLRLTARQALRLDAELAGQGG